MKFTVPDMSCSHCKAAIENAISEAGGRATIDLDTKSVTVEGIDEARATDAIREAGYDAQPA